MKSYFAAMTGTRKSFDVHAKRARRIIGAALMITNIVQLRCIGLVGCSSMKFFPSSKGEVLAARAGAGVSILVARHPLKRLLSAYFDKFLGGGNGE